MYEFYFFIYLFFKKIYFIFKLYIIVLVLTAYQNPIIKVIWFWKVFFLRILITISIFWEI